MHSKAGVDAGFVAFGKNLMSVIKTERLPEVFREFR